MDNRAAFDFELASQKVDPSDYIEMIQENGRKHELNCWKNLQKEVSTFIEISQRLSSTERADKTIKAMKDGIEIIFQGGFIFDDFVARPDFLVKTHSPSKLGYFSYEVIDAKLSQSVKADSVLQLMHYSDAIGRVQGMLPTKAFLILGDNDRKTIKVKDCFFYYKNLMKRFISYIQNLNDLKPVHLPCSHCDLCHWRNFCSKRWIEKDDLAQVARITRDQIVKLNKKNLLTMEELSNSSRDLRLGEFNYATYLRLQQQASLQIKSKKEGGKPIFELIKSDEDDYRKKMARNQDVFGFGRLPEPNQGDLFFDIEGDPLYEEKLEYLFGIFFISSEKEEYKSFWALSLKEEKKTFGEFLNFLSGHLERFPNARIYHYASYEKDALRRLSNKYNIGQRFVDNLLRNGTLVDLYQIVRESIRISEPRYSIKNLEKFYQSEFGKREDSVTNGSDSVVFFEMWKDSGADINSEILKDIEKYNLQDVRSTYFLRNWLLKIAKTFGVTINQSDSNKKDIAEISEKAKGYAKDLAIITRKLSQEISKFNDGDCLRENLIDLLDFYKRDAKSQWWNYFDRKELSSEERNEREDCIVGLILEKKTSEKRSNIYHCKFLSQKTSIKTNDKCIDLTSGKSLANLSVNHRDRKVQFKASSDLQFPIDIGLSGPVQSDVLSESIFRFGRDINTYRALSQLMRRHSPTINNDGNEKDLSRYKSPKLLADLITRMDHSLIFIQGPPGTGKTFLMSRVAVILLSMGFKIGVTSNSHKAILNILYRIESFAKEQQVFFRGAKKSSKENTSQHFSNKETTESLIEDLFKVDDLINGDYQLLAGTAWFFANEKLDQTIDYLIVEEAGQMALATAIAAGTSAKSLILLGDQNQLEQPVQGVHPNNAGLSVVNYYLTETKNSDDIHTVVPSDKGIFLNKTYRLHPSICDFVSEAFYESKLVPSVSNLESEIIWSKNNGLNLKRNGIQLLLTSHNSCSKSSEVEAKKVCEIFETLLDGSFYKSKEGKKKIDCDDILVVAPYNMQVELLKSLLPEGSKVGTIDKFQGQEARVVLVSMTTSSAEEIGKDVAFLFSKNRLNVAITRAKTLVVVLFNDKLLEFPCKTQEQVHLVNTFCWLHQNFHE